MTPLDALLTAAIAQLGEKAIRGPVADLVSIIVRAVAGGDAELAERLDAAILRAQSRNRAAEVAAELDEKIRKLDAVAHAPTDPPPATERSSE